MITAVGMFGLAPTLLWFSTYLVQFGLSSPHFILRFLHGLWKSESILKNHSQHCSSAIQSTYQQPWRLLRFGSGASAFLGLGISVRQV